MDNTNLHRYLNEQVLAETLKGGPAYYRPAHQDTDPLTARLHAELRDEKKANGTHRMLRLKLPGLAPRYLRLPKWVLVGRLTA